jgi:Xaa-Pro dipeptidase
MADSSESNPEQLTTVLLPHLRRAADVAEKQKRVADFLQRHAFNALLLQRPENVAWMTAGADVTRAGSSETIAAVFMTADARLVITNNVDSPLLFERELYGLGFQLKERSWQKSRDQLIEDLCRGRRVASDCGFPSTVSVNHQLRCLRLPLTVLECDRMRQLGRLAVHAVEATAMSFYRGQTEAEIAGEVAHRLIKHSVIPERIQVCADGRGNRFRHWSYGDDAILNYVQIGCVARRWGLNVGVTRTVAFERLPEELRVAHQKTVLMHATGMFFSNDGIPSGELWQKVHRIYEKFGLPNEWKLADQAEIVGYKLREWCLVSEPACILTAPIPVFWHPSCGPSGAGDTILVTKSGTELLTPIRCWPRLTVHVRNTPVQCADVLVRDVVDWEPDTLVIDKHVERVNSTATVLRDTKMSVDNVDSNWEIETIEHVT